LLSDREAIVARTNGSLKDRLARYRQIKFGVLGRKTGQTISMSLR
jgi:hypothetical protein